MSGASSGQRAPATVIFLHGPPACGKLTIAREVCALTGFALFHNHLVVDLLLSIFPFGSPEFVRHRERIWLVIDSTSASPQESARRIVAAFTLPATPPSTHPSHG